MSHADDPAMIMIIKKITHLDGLLKVFEKTLLLRLLAEDDRHRLVQLAHDQGEHLAACTGPVWAHLPQTSPADEYCFSKSKLP